MSMTLMTVFLFYSKLNTHINYIQVILALNGTSNCQRNEENICDSLTFTVLTKSIIKYKDINIIIMSFQYVGFLTVRDMRKMLVVLFFLS
jgi:hypothetical protein